MEAPAPTSVLTTFESTGGGTVFTGNEGVVTVFDVLVWLPVAAEVDDLPLTAATEDNLLIFAALASASSCSKASVSSRRASSSASLPSSPESKFTWGQKQWD